MLSNRSSLSIGAFRTITVCAVLLGVLMTICGPAHAQTQPQTPTASAGPPAPNGQPGGPTNGPERLSTVVVTGTSIQSAQAAAYESAPIAIITGEDIQRAGVANIEDYFQTQPNFVLSGQSSYSNTTAASGLNGTQIGGTTLNLRGIGPQYTLVLVNGRRFQAEDPANLDLIPLDAIDRIEVLKSGASAVYGSDAVAGVVNIITKRSADGWSVGTYYGESERSGRQHHAQLAELGHVDRSAQLLCGGRILRTRRHHGGTAPAERRSGPEPLQSGLQL